MALTEDSPVSDKVKGTPDVIPTPRETEEGGRMEVRGWVRLMGKTWHNWGGIKGPSEKGEKPQWGWKN